MGKKRAMTPAEDVDLSSIKYEREVVQAPHLTGFVFRFFVRILEAPLIGPIIINYLKKQNKINQVCLLQYTVIPEEPMFKPEYPPQGEEYAKDGERKGLGGICRSIGRVGLTIQEQYILQFSLQPALI
ncbi:fatty acid amide hydrolase-like isoform X2 [Cajanus cajan]|uniref:fatty acid amide hydrolase-like isoform X2 n=1 Tax=Cajanus cajan TaxID=3821 RepID=UPI00098DC1AD|nr:fatty acid amide hydrolase-like isoform X2 [Cajanus cajan]